MVCHCLLIEGDGRLVLVDTGLGLGDIADPKGRLGGAFVAATGARLDSAECAVRQVERLGFRPDDVTDVVVTHLDLDHAGGIGDFPRAKVHVYGAELDAALARSTLRERERYKTAHWAHGPTWVRHTANAGDKWKGFDRAALLSDGDVEVVMIPLHGHTRGHSGVVVRNGDRWLVHAGDAYFFHEEMSSTPWCPPGLRAFQAAVAIDDAARRHNQSRLRELAAQPDVTIFSAHDASEFDGMA